jgi:hypothetical protein
VERHVLPLRGTFSFVVRATDTRGAFAERTFSITVT